MGCSSSKATAAAAVHDTSTHDPPTAATAAAARGSASPDSRKSPEPRSHSRFRSESFCIMNESRSGVEQPAMPLFGDTNELELRVQ